MDPLKLSKLFADKYTTKILAEALDGAVSTQELSIKFDIPIAGCYRRIKELEKNGLLKCVATEISSKGKKVRLYRSLVKSAYISYKNGELAVKLKMVDEELEPITSQWEVVPTR